MDLAGGSSVASAPLLLANLLRDTAPGDSTNSDGITRNPAIAGIVSSSLALGGLAVSFEQTGESFLEIPAELGSDGSFTLTPELLAAAYGGTLPDGQYLLRLRATDSANTASNEQAISFTLDTTAPTLNLTSNLPAGIAWVEGEQSLIGQVMDGVEGASVFYHFSDGDEAELTPDANGQISQVLDLPNAPGVYQLRVTVADLAGNTQVRDYSFLIRDLLPVLDDDTLAPTLGTVGEDHPTRSGAGGQSGQWGYVGFGGGWGFAGSGSGGGPFNEFGWQPSNFDGFDGSGDPSIDYIGSGYGSDNPTYLEKLDKILETASGVISTHASTVQTKAALINRTPLLRALGRLVDGQVKAAQTANEANPTQFYDALKAVLHGLFDEADSPVLNTPDAVKEGYMLAQDLVRDSLPQTRLSVKVQTYQATLMAVASKVLDERNYAWTEAQMQQMSEAFLKIASLYAKFNPSVPTDASSPLNWLAGLWAAQTDANTPDFKLMAGVTNLNHFISNLLEAAASVSDLTEELQNGQFVQELVAFGFELAKLDLDTATTTSGDDAFAGFLRSLWGAPLTEQGMPLTQDLATIKAANGLSELFGGVNTVEEGLHRIQFAENLIEAAGLAPSLTEQANDLEFLDALLGLGGAYAELEPTSSSTTGVEGQNLGFFLDTLLKQNINSEASTGSMELANFLSETTNKNSVLYYGSELLRLAKRESENLGKKYETDFFYKLINFAKFDVNLDSSSDPGIENIPENLVIPMYFAEIVSRKKLTPYEQVLKQLSPLHRQIMNEATQLNPTPGTDDRWDISDNIRWSADKSYRNEFREQWICGFKDIINAASQKFNISSKLIAAIAWTEVGGYPESADDAAYLFRRVGIGTSTPADQTSFSSLSVQIRTAARALGYDPKNITIGQRSIIISSLNDPRQAIFIAAKHLSDLRKGCLPFKSSPQQLTESEIIGLAGAYNLGAVLPKFDDFLKPIPNSGFNPSVYGKASLNGLKTTSCYNFFR